MSASEPLLGNTTKFASAREEFKSQYGHTALRFFLQSAVRELLPEERIRICYRFPVNAAQDVHLIYSDERARARAANTMKCGSVWLCPVCASYITEQRRIELKLALERARDNYFAVLITWTVAHGANMPLADTMQEMQQKFRKLKSGRRWQDIKREWFLAGSVRATEITWGSANGWHPHYHELVFADVEALAEVLDGRITEYARSLQTQLSGQWQAVLAGSRWEPSLDRGVTIRCTDSDVAEYVAKWGKMPLAASDGNITYEITHGQLKTPYGGNLSVYDLFFEAGQGNEQAKALVREYAEATKGRSQLQWSRGLKRLLAIDDIRDELAAEGVETDTDRLLASISAEFWRVIVRYGYLAQTMSIANQGDQVALLDLLGRLEKHYPMVALDLGLYDR